MKENKANYLYLREKWDHWDPTLIRYVKFF